MVSGTFAVEAFPTDHEAVVAARCGQRAAFDALTLRYYGSLLRYLRVQTGDPALAEDLAQEVFLDAYRHLHQLSDEGSFAAWLFRIAQNRLRMHWRHERLKSVVSLDWLLERPIRSRSLPSQDDMTATFDEGAVTRTILTSLSPPLRDALLLHSVEGFTAPEVAMILGISRSAAERRISRAKAEFRQKYCDLHQERQAR